MRWICLSWGVWRLIRRRNCSHCWWVCFGRQVPIPLPSSVLSTSGERKIGRVPPEVVKKRASVSLQVESPQAGLPVLPASETAGISSNVDR